MEKEKSELINWSDRLSCGIKLLDDQHKGLVALVNDMFNHVSGDEIQEYAYFNGIVQEVIKYVKIHFATEEKIMLAAKIPGYDAHKKAHSRFIFAVVENINNYKTEKRFNLYIFTRYLKDWILSHIALMDKQYFEQIKILPAAEKLLESQCGWDLRHIA